MLAILRPPPPLNAVPFATAADTTTSLATAAFMAIASNATTLATTSDATAIAATILTTAIAAATHVAARQLPLRH